MEGDQSTSIEWSFETSKGKRVLVDSKRFRYNFQAKTATKTYWI